MTSGVGDGVTIIGVGIIGGITDGTPTGEKTPGDVFGVGVGGRMGVMGVGITGQPPIN